MTGVAGRVTVLTAVAELLLAAAADDAGEIAAALTLLVAPLAPFAAPRMQSGRSQTSRSMRLARRAAHSPFLASMYLP